MLTIGHRGARGYVAENTLESIQKALDLHVDGVEIDVYQCGSGEIVVFHDKRLNRLTGNRGFIGKTNFDELNTMLVKANSAKNESSKAIIKHKKSGKAIKAYKASR